MKHLSGILPAIVTPLDAEGHFHERAFEKLAARLYGAGVDGLYVCGQTGEGLQLSVPQRKLVTEAAVAHSPAGKTVMIHVGAHTTADAIELARHASEAGAAAISSLPPIGNYTFEEVRAYYQAIAAAAGAPLLIYYFPSLSAAIKTTDQILELCRIPNVVGLKFTDSDLFRLWSIRRTGAIVFNGSDEMLVAGLIMGASGGIGSTYNLIPGAYVEMWAHAREGRWEEARAVQDRVNEFIAVLLRYPINPAVKSLLAASGMDCGGCVEPRRVLTADEHQSLRSAIAGTALGGELLGVAAAR